MKRNERGTLRKGMAAGVWLGVALGIGLLVPSGLNADDVGTAEPSTSDEAPAAVDRASGDVAAEAEVVEAADAVATATATEESESAGPRPVIRFQNANPVVIYGGLIERRMGAEDSDSETMRQAEVYDLQQDRSDRSSRIRSSGAGTGRSARYHTRGLIRYDGVTRARDRARIATIRVHWMGADRSVQRFGMAAY